ncbi:hypothetical protein [Sphingomonas sp.]|uniref:hypothetical protein n=1 Tax=Sphingomonas sp. TaxID=28214 RepID=UPI003BAA1FF2
MRFIPLLAASVALASCSNVVPPAPAPPPPPRPVPAPAPAPAPAPPPASSDWRDWPAARGDWSYRQEGQGTIALFGLRTDQPELSLRCDRATRQVQIARRGEAPGPITIRTSTTARSLAARATPGAQPYMAVMLPANDPILDAMGYSRGRFVVEMPPLAPLVVPTWAEVQRVVEDCRR